MRHVSGSIETGAPCTQVVQTVKCVIEDIQINKIDGRKKGR
jgi:hypothetical protein